jgi:hypothetical protein
MNPSKALADALALAAEGVPVFPCAANKHPTCPHGFKEATADSAAVIDLWKHHPGPLVAFATGTISGRDVLDLDAKHPEATAWWMEHRHHLPATTTHRTRSGGLHLLFRHAEGLRNSASKIARGVDTRGDGGYAIHWPSAGFRVLSDAPLAPWPPWFLDKLMRRPETPSTRKPTQNPTLSDRRLAQLVRLVANASEGERNSTLFWAACRISEGSGDLDFAAEVLIAAAARAGLPADEASRTVRSAALAGR